MRTGALVSAAAVGLALLAGCGSTPEPAAGHPTGAGDPQAVPAAAVPGGRLSSGPFTLLPTAPQGYEGVAGTAEMARHDGGTTVTVTFTGLRPDTDYVSHVHSGQCAEGGGPHFRIDPAGSEMPPNEIHLKFRSDASGAATATAENPTVVGADARAVVVHPADLMDNRVACAPLS
ncbi:hypothetical protein ACVGVM_17410 [Pseudonocardia bannensis]|uniref:Superoxide dismutase family protein n=1 Tax=Pseudonocardia bannensis TaxID=630973 RepID=A0A848DJA5_9PSEU|nr:superoxide dismutase family protein [Pseudonocardia bannensis]NMH92787.1 superoxide dismutase family protein [Pseudonocardia bannensis]